MPAGGGDCVESDLILLAESLSLKLALAHQGVLDWLVGLT
jgi:hypothetical protein